VETIRTAVENVSRHLAEHADAGIGTDSAATAVLEGGLKFRVAGPDGDLVTDMSKSVGGGETAPSPGWTLRAALASCDASLVVMEAAREGVELTHLEVTVTSESDSRGLLGVDESIPAGPLSVRTEITIAANNADEGQLRAIAARAEARSPVRDAIARDVPVTTEVTVRD
jgi:uncharacterized OsmC-like protein